MKFDDLISELGEFGPYQQRLYFTVCLVGIPAALQALAGNFIQATPDHRCALPTLPNDTYASQGPWHDDLINVSIPWDSDGDIYDKCHLRKYTGDLGNETVSCDKWVYKRDTFKSTFVSDQNLVCDEKAFVTYASIVFMAGILVGSLIMGFLSDVLGRKKVLVLSSLSMFAASFGTAWADSYPIYVALRFFTSFFGVSMYISAFVIGMELVGPNQRKVAGMIIQLFWCIGLFLETGFAYYLRDWRHFQMSISMFSIITAVVYPLFLPESARWLLQKGKTEEASKIILKAAEMNGVTLSGRAQKLDLEVEGQRSMIWHMFSYPILLFRYCVLFMNWFVASMVYYGLNLTAGNLFGDIYINFFLMAVVELVSYIFCLALLDRVGRKFLQCSSMILGGVACTAILFPVMFGGGDYKCSMMITILSLTGKFGASAGFAVIYVYSAELFPTVMRSSGIGICSFMARAGGIIAPYVGDLSNFIKGDLGITLPLVIFGGSSIVAGLLVLPLPETTNKVLPDTMKDAKNIGKSEKTAKKKYAVKTGAEVAPQARYNPTFSYEL